MRSLGIVPRYALATFGVALALGLVLVSAVLVAEARGDLRHISERMTAKAEGVAAADPTSPAAARAALDGAGHARIYGPDGTLLAGGGSEALWSAGPGGWLARAATTGVDGSPRAGAFEVVSDLPSGGRVALREVVPAAHAGMGTRAQLLAVGGAVLAAAVLAGLAGLYARRLGTALNDLAHAADAIGVARSAPRLEVGRSPELGSVAAAVSGAAARSDDFRAAAEVRFDALAAALTPLSMPAAARTPAGAVIRNPALEMLVRDLNGDRAAVESLVNESLTGGGAVSRRLPLHDGRVLDVDAWGVPGGRVVTVHDTTEQQRAEALRVRLSGGAMRSLRPPVAEIRSASQELYNSLPSAGAAPLQRILRSADRLDRLTRALLRGGPHDPAETPVARRPVGVAGLLFDAAREWDAGLKPRALRVELELDDDLPVVDTDPALLEEILGELVENAAKFSRRGGTITVAASRARDGAVEVAVRDTAGGFSPQDASQATELFYRGQNADALPGTGLGLGVASALAARIGARLEIAPGPAGGVHIVLPAAAPSPPRSVAA